MPLTDAQARAAKPREKPYKLADAGGLYLEVMPNGARYWRWKYRVGGKEKRLALGVYPRVTLAEARTKRDAARAQLTGGTDPVAARQQAKRLAALAAANTFATVAIEWHATQAAGRWTPRYAETVMRGLEQHVFPALGHRPIDAITAGELLATLRALQTKGTIDRANRLRQTCGEVFRYGIVTGRCSTNPAGDLVRALQPSRQRHFSALTKEQLPAFLQALAKEHRLALTTRIGLRLLALTFVRPGELRQAAWREFDLEHATWEIPEERMKMREAHIVPLSPQAVAALRELHAITGQGELLFPGRSNVRQPVSDNTFRQALHAMGFEVTAHGFRSTASTILNEMGFRADVIERQLSHGERNKVRKAYNRAQYLEERRDMMRHWGDYLEALERGGKVVPIHQRNGVAE